MERLVKNESIHWTIGFALITAAVTALFSWNITDHGFWMDEMYHALGAKYILSEGSPVFPTGDTYTRALGYTHIVALSYKLFGISEFSGRLPSLLFMLLFIFLGGIITRRMFGTYASLLFMLVMGLSPLSVELTRFSRMYTAFSFFYFMAVWTFFYGFEWRYTGEKSNLFNKPIFNFETSHKINLKLLVLSCIFFVLSKHMHEITLTFPIALAGYSFFKITEFAIKKNISAWLKSKYFLVIVFMLLIGILLLLFRPDLAGSIKHTIFFRATWAERMDMGIGFYRVYLSETYPFFFFAYPVAAIYTIYKYKNIGLYLLANFLLLFLLHSFVIEMKQTRYFYYVLPFFILSCMPLCIDIIRYIWSRFEELAYFRLAWVKGSCIVALVIFLNVFTYPWLNEAKNIPKSHPDVNWKAFSQAAKNYMKPGIPVLATDQLTYLYYFNEKPDYYLSLQYHNKKGDSEYFAGSQPITSFEELESLTSSLDEMYIVSKRWKLNYYVYANEAIRNHINQNFERIPLDSINDIYLYRKKESDRLHTN